MTKIRLLITDGHDVVRQGRRGSYREGQGGPTSENSVNVMFGTAPVRAPRTACAGKRKAGPRS